MGNLQPNAIIKLSKSSIGDLEKRAVLGVLDREYLGMGVEVQKFELALTEFFDRPVVSVVNGTAAIHLALQACGIGLGDEVLVQSLTYVASFQAISASGAKPVACDVNPDTLTIDLNDAEKRLTPQTKAIMPVHYSGGVGDLDEIYSFAHTHGLRVIEDAAHAFGTKFRNKLVGNIGDIACFSFDGIKNITSGEGGCIVTSDEKVLSAARDARLLGVEKDSEKRFNSERSWDFDVTAQGWRYHMSNIMAAIGIEQLKRFPDMLQHRQNVARRYTNQIRKIHSVQIIENDYNSVCPHIFPVILPDACDRAFIQKSMLDWGIQTGFHYLPNHWLTLYDDKSTKLSVTDQIFPRLLTLPLHCDLSYDDVDYVVSSLEKILY